MAKKTYIVARHMIGDKEYKRGDKRTIDESAAAGLVASGALVELRQGTDRAAAKAAASAAAKTAADKAAADKAA